MLIDRYADQVRYVVLPLVWRDELHVGFGPAAERVLAAGHEKSEVPRNSTNS